MIVHSIESPNRDSPGPHGSPLFKNSEDDPAAEITAGPPVRQGQVGPMQRLCQKLTIGRYASTGDRRSDLTYRHGSDFGAGRKRRENLRQTRDTELANDPDMRSETDFLDTLLARGIREIKRESQHEC